MNQLSGTLRYLMHNTSVYYLRLLCTSHKEKVKAPNFGNLSPPSCGERMRRPCSEDLRRSVLASLVATLGFPVRPHAAPVRVGNQRHGALMGIEGGQHSLEGLVACKPAGPSAPTVWGLNIFPSLRSLHSLKSLGLVRWVSSQP